MRTNIDHDVCSEMILARDVRAGDLVPGLGVVNAVLEAGSHAVLLCSGKEGREFDCADYVEVFAGLCGDCGETLDDCDNEGGHGA